MLLLAWQRNYTCHPSRTIPSLRKHSLGLGHAVDQSNHQIGERGIWLPWSPCDERIHAKASKKRLPKLFLKAG